MAIIQASTVLSLAEKVNVVTVKLLQLLTFNELLSMVFFGKTFTVQHPVEFWVRSMFYCLSPSSGFSK